MTQHAQEAALRLPQHLQLQLRQQHRLQRPLPPQHLRAPAPARAAGERVKASPLARKLAADAGIDIAAIGGTGPEGRVVQNDVLAYQAANKFRITPVADKMAKENNIDLKQVVGTGPAGKITKEDIEAYLAKAKAAPAAAAHLQNKRQEEKKCPKAINS